MTIIHLTMATQGQSKKAPESKERDPLSLFIQQAHSLLERYFKYFLLTVVSGLLIFGLFLLNLHWQKQKNNRTEEILYQSRKKVMQAEKKAGGNILSFDRNQNFFGESKTGDYSAELKEQTEQYIHLIQKHMAQASALQAVSGMAHFLYEYDQKSQALALLKTADSHKKPNLTGFLNSFQLGAFLLEQKDYEGAVQSFLFITQNERAKWLWPEALIKLSLSYEGQNKTDQAKATYREAMKINSPLSQQATQYLNLLSLREKINQNKKNDDKK